MGCFSKTVARVTAMMETWFPFGFLCPFLSTVSNLESVIRSQSVLSKGPWRPKGRPKGSDLLFAEAVKIVDLGDSPDVGKRVVEFTKLGLREIHKWCETTEEIYLSDKAAEISESRTQKNLVVPQGHSLPILFASCTIARIRFSKRWFNVHATFPVRVAHKGLFVCHQRS
jgi:hypothetical protein